MQKLYTILTSFDVYALNRLRKWLCSPATNEKTVLIDLFDDCRALVKPDKKGTVMDWATAKKKFPPKDANTYSDLIKRIEEWFFFEETTQNKVQQTLAIARFYAKHELHQHVADELNYAKNMQNNQIFRNANWHYDEYCLAEMEESRNVKMVRQTRKTNLQYICKQFDIFYIAKRLGHYIDALTYKNFLQLDINTAGLTELLTYIDALGLRNEPLIAIYCHSVMTLQEPQNTAHFNDLVATLNTHHALFTSFEARELYTVALNYCVRRINAGESVYFHKLFELYQTVLEKQVIFVNGILPEWDYKNITTVGLQLGNYDWVEDFLHTYSHKIPLHLRENALTYNLAKLYFAKADYNKVIEKLRDVQYLDMVYNLDSRATLLKTYYEIESYDALDSLLESFRISLLRNKSIATTVKKQYENLIHFTKKIMVLSPKNQKMREQLIEKIETTPQIADKKWLLQKLRKEI